MVIFIYDQTFEGLLSAIYDAYILKRFPDHLRGSGELAALAAPGAHQVETRPDKIERVFRSVYRKLTRQGLQHVLLAWLSEEDGSEDLLFRYLCKVLDSGGQTEKDLGDPDVLAVWRLARKVARQVERYAGYVRFQKTGQGVYFAVIEPRHNLLPLLKRHFAGRLAGQAWAIYDAVRHYGVFWDKSGFRDFTINEALLCDGGLRPDLLAEGERLLQRLWQGYFAACAVRERLNTRRQQRCMPRKYWKYLPEKQPVRPWPDL